MKPSLRTILLIALIIIALIAPLQIAAQTYLLHIIVLIFLFAALAQSWNLLAGYAGQPSLGHALFFGMGAYTAGILTLHTEYFKTNPWPSLILGGFVGALLGIAIGAVCFRLRGPYFALATLAATEVARLIVMNSEFTNGAIGITIRVPPPITTTFFTIDFTEKLPYYYITLVIMILSFYAVYTLSKSRYGLLLRSIRDDEDAAMTLGVNAFRLKLFTMFISGFIAGVVGSLYAIYISYIDPAMDPGGVLTLFTSIEPVLITIIGGAATVIGPLIGSVIRVGVGEYLRVIFGWRAGMDLIFFGLIFLIIFFLARKGIWGLIRSRIKIR
jgi:branched-chain amino acid transport system permease protein